MLYVQKSRNRESYIKFGAMAAILLPVDDTIHGTAALHPVLHGDLAGFYRGRKSQTKKHLQQIQAGEETIICFSHLDRTKHHEIRV